MTADRELLELAAKAAGYSEFRIDEAGEARVRKPGGFSAPWNPLEDDGDALRLAVKLGLSIIQQRTLRGPEPVAASCGFGGEDFRLTSTDYNGDPFAATRRAIVRAAAEIGRAMP